MYWAGCVSSRSINLQGLKKDFISIFTILLIDSKAALHIFWQATKLVAEYKHFNHVFFGFCFF